MDKDGVGAAFTRAPLSFEVLVRERVIKILKGLRDWKIDRRFS